MKLTFLGTSHGITEKDRYTSSTLVSVGGKHYIIDAGAPIMKLLQEKDVDFADIGGVFITHSHGDHYMGLVEFTNQIEVFARFQGLKINITAPELFPFAEMRKFLFGDEEDGGINIKKAGGSRSPDEGMNPRVTCTKYTAGKIFEDENIKITAFKTKHFTDSHSLLIEAEGKKVLFTGDLRHDLIDFPFEATEGGDDLVIMEAAHSLFDSEIAINTFKKIDTKRMLVNHIYVVRNTPEMVATADASVDYPISIVNDNDVFEI